MTRNKLSYILAITLLLLSGCTSPVYNFPVNVHKEYPVKTKEKINISVGLIMSDEFRKAQIITKLVGGSETIVLGPFLEQNTEALVRELFTTVFVSKDPKTFLNKEIDAILTPRLTGVSRNLVGAGKFQSLIAKLEWTLKDKKGNLVWIETVTGQGDETVKYMPFTQEKEMRERAKKEVVLMNVQLFNNSFNAISESKEIKEFAKKIDRKIY